MEKNRSLEEVRQEIDRVDQIVKKAFLERMGLSEEVAWLKRKNGAAVYQPDREKRMIQGLTEDVDPDVRQEYEELIRKILELSRSYQNKKQKEWKDETFF